MASCAASVVTHCFYSPAPWTGNLTKKREQDNGKLNLCLFLTPSDTVMLQYCEREC